MSGVPADLAAKESEVTATIVNAIRFAQNYCRPLTPDSAATIIELCKAAGKATLKFKTQIQVVRRPYIIYANDLASVCNLIERIMEQLRKHVAQAIPSPDAEQLQALSVVNQHLNLAEQASKDFMAWIRCSMNSYLFQNSEKSLLEVPEPDDLEVARQDMMRCPRWILRQLFEARTHVETGKGNVSSEADNGGNIPPAGVSRGDSFRLGSLDPISSQQLEELKNLKTQVTQHENTVNSLHARLKSSTEQVQQKEKAILEKEQSLIQKTGQVQKLTQRITELESQLETQQKQLPEEFSKLETENAILSKELERMSRTVADRDAHIKKLSIKLKQLFDTLGASKRKEKEVHVAIKQQQDKIAELENKLRINQAQLRMSRINADHALSDKEMYEAQILASIQEPLPDAGDELKEADRILEEMLDQHTKDNENVRNAIAFELSQMEDETPTLEVDFSTASTWMNEAEKRQCIAQLVLDKSRDYEFIRVLGKIFQTGAEADTVVKALLELYQDQDRGLELIYSMIDYEVKHTKSPIQLFRGEEFPPRMIRAYTRLLGLEFAQRVLGELIMDITDKQLQLELDDNRAENAPPIDVEEQVSLLMDLSQKFFNAIVSSLSYMPLEFLQIANYLTKQVRKRFPEPEATQAAVAGFIFLRFFCPCIASPESFDFPDVGPMETRRTLLLIGKVLQCLANGVTTFKEAYLEPMTPFLERNRSALEEFVRHIREWPPRTNGNSDYLIRIEHIVHKKKDKIIELVQPGGPFADAGAASWKQNIETQPHSRVKGILEKMPHDKPVGAVAVAKLNRTKFPLEKRAPTLQGLLLTYLDSEGVPVAVTKCLLARKKQGDPNVSSICADLGIIFLANDSLEFLMKSIILTEISEALGVYEYLHDSVTKMIFDWYTKNYATTWLAEEWGSVVATIVDAGLYFEIEPAENLDPNKPLDASTIADNLDKLKKFFTHYTETALKGLTKCPRPLWEFASILADYTSQDVFQFIFINFFAMALRDPVTYKLTNKKPNRQAMRTLGILGEMIENIANGTECLIKTEACPPDLRKRYVDTLASWAIEEQMDLVDQDYDIPWQVERDALMNLTDFLLETSDIIDTELMALETVQHNVTFGIIELLESLVPPPFPEEKRRPFGTPGKFRPDPGNLLPFSVSPSTLGPRASSSGTLGVDDGKKKSGIFGKKGKKGEKDKGSQDKDKDKGEKQKKV